MRATFFWFLDRAVVDMSGCGIKSKGCEIRNKLTSEQVQVSTVSVAVVSDRICLHASPGQTRPSNTTVRLWPRGCIEP